LVKEHLCDVVDYLVRFFVRRNLTDRPATNSLTPLFMDIIDRISALTGDSLVKTIRQELISVSSNEDDFRKRLEGKIYSENSGVTRFILCAIEENAGKIKVEKGPWEKEGKQYVWTIEHILPQGVPLSPEWVMMIADGDEDLAKELQLFYVDRIGNLTLTGYNSELGNKSFEYKKDRKTNKKGQYEGQYVGYMSGHYLNEGLKNLPKWTIKDIENRTAQLVDKTLELFALEDKNNIIEAQ
jgi:hypothetical protein